MADEPQETPETGAPAPDPEPVASGDDVESLRKALAKANKEAEKHRLELKALKPLAEKAQQLEDASKSELEKLTEAANAAKAEAAAATTELQRLQVALEKVPPGTDMATVRSLARRLQGGTPEELEADAVELVALLLPTSNTTSPPAPGQRTPVEQLRPGAMPTGTAPSLADQIAAAEAANDWKLSMVLKSQVAQELRANQP